MGTVLYAATNEGVTTFCREGSGEWRVTEGEFPAAGVTGLVVDPEAPNVVHAATRGAGVLHSDDFGATWRAPEATSAGPKLVRCIASDPHDANRLYAGGEPIDVFVSDDRGAHWEPMSSLWETEWIPTVDFGGSPTAQPHVRDIAVDPSDPDTMYIALQVAYLMKSTDRGETWTLLDRDIDADVHAVCLDPADRDHLVIATGGHDCRAGKAPGRALYASHDGGEHWYPLAMNFPQDYSLPMVALPGSPGVLFSSLADGTPGAWRERAAGADAVMIRSDDGGETWSEVDLSAVPDSSRRMVTAIAADVAQRDSVFAGFHDGVLLESSDGGGSWSPLPVAARSLSDLAVVSV